MLRFFGRRVSIPQGIRRAAEIDALTGQTRSASARLGATGAGIRGIFGLARGVGDFAVNFGVTL